MAEAGLFARQDAELRANLSQLAKRFEPTRAEHMDVQAKSSHPSQWYQSLNTSFGIRNSILDPLKVHIHELPAIL